MAFNQSFKPVKSGLITSTSSTNIIASNNASQKSSRYGELSSSGIESDWVVFSPSIDEDEEDDEEVLSTTNEYEEEEEEDGSDEEDSLIDSLDTNNGLRLSLPTHDGSGQFMNSYNESSDDHDGIFNNNLSKEDFITNRIDNWRREQARLLIEELQHSETSSSSTATREPSPINDILASWGVDDRDPIQSKLGSDDASNNQHTRQRYQQQKAQVQSKPYKHGTKRFYGDAIFENYSEWEVSMIKKVAKELSSSLVRDRRNESMDFYTGMRSRRSSFLSNLSQKAINSYLMGSNSYFWKKDLSSAHSSISTNSIMFGNSWGDVA